MSKISRTIDEMTILETILKCYRDHKCDGCPYFNEPHCKDVLSADFFELASKRIQNAMRICPWCKDDAALEVETEHCRCAEHDWIYVSCVRCGARGPCRTISRKPSNEEWQEARQKVIELWNNQ